MSKLLSRMHAVLRDAVPRITAPAAFHYKGLIQEFVIAKSRWRALILARGLPARFSISHKIFSADDHQFLGATLLRVELSAVNRGLIGFPVGVSPKKPRLAVEQSGHPRNICGKICAAQSSPLSARATKHTT